MNKRYYKKIMFNAMAQSEIIKHNNDDSANCSRNMVNSSR